MFFIQDTPKRGPIVVRSWTLQGLHGIPVDVEVDVRPGLPQCIMVGLPDTSIIEARDRVRSAIANTGLKFPPTRVTVNLAPAHVRKQGTQFDVPIALGLIAAAQQCRIPTAISIIGEVALDGRIRAIKGALPLVVSALEQTEDIVIAPRENAPELSLLTSERVRVAESLKEIVDAFRIGSIPQSIPHHVIEHYKSATINAVPVTNVVQSLVDCRDIIGQPFAKRAIEIAAAGQHHVLFSGPPGVGKSMLAAALATILPPMTNEERTTVAMIHSLVSPLSAVPQTRPFRSPHHTTSPIAVVGGGTALLPGEITLAHHGVLFLDELPEFRRDVLEALRQPMENGTITITRASGQVTYPAQCIIVGAYNPCPCGYYRSQQRQCTCSMVQINRYQKKLSGPLIDRCDIKVAVKTVDPDDEQSSKQQSETSQTIRCRVTAARKRQIERQGRPNATLYRQSFSHYAPLSPDSRRLLSYATRTYHLSMRSHDKTVRVARTIADLAGESSIAVEHVAEALQFTAPLQELHEQ